MLSLGGSLAIKAVFFTAAYVPFVILINTYAQLASQGNDLSEQLRSSDVEPTLAAKLANITVTPNVEGAGNGAALPAPPKKVLPAECKKMRMVLAKRFTKVIRKCSLALQDVFTDREEFSKHFQCVLQCVLLDVQAVEKDGLKMTNGTVQSFMDAQVPLKYHELLFPLVVNCLNEWGSKLDPEDEFCVNMGNLFKCVQHEISECQSSSNTV